MKYFIAGPPAFSEYYYNTLIYRDILLCRLYL